MSHVPRRRPGVLLRDLRRSAAAGHDLVRQHQLRVEPRRRPHLDAASASSAAPARSPCTSITTTSCSIRPNKDHVHHRQRRRRLRDVRPRQALREPGQQGTRTSRVALLLEPADHAVLPRVGRQRGAVLHGVRRHAGQLLDVRSVAHDAHARHPHERLVHRARRRRLLQRATIRAIRTSSTRSSQDGGLVAVRSAHRTRHGHPAELRHGAAMRSAPAAPAPAAPAAAAPARRRRRGGAVAAAAAAAVAAAIAPNWDAPYITSPHSHDAALLGQPVSLSHRRSRRRLDAHQSGSHAQSRLADDSRSWARCGRRVRSRCTSRRRALSNIVSIDESPLLEGLLYRRHRRRPGADHRRRRPELAQGRGLPGRAEVGVRDGRARVAARRRTSCSSTLNNWQRGDYKPYLVKQRRSRPDVDEHHGRPAGASTTCGRSRRITSTPNLLFAGTEFGLFFTVDGGRHWVQLKGGMPPAQVRDMQIQKRESDVVMATFGRGFWVLDDYTRAARSDARQTLAEEARLFPTRARVSVHAVGPGAGRLGRPRDARRQLHDAESAVRRGAHLHVRETLPDDTQLVANILDSQGTQVRRLDARQDRRPASRRRGTCAAEARRCRRWRGGGRRAARRPRAGWRAAAQARRAARRRRRRCAPAARPGRRRTRRRWRTRRPGPLSRR